MGGYLEKRKGPIGSFRHGGSVGVCLSAPSLAALQRSAVRSCSGSKKSLIERTSQSLASSSSVVSQSVYSEKLSRTPDAEDKHETRPRQSKSNLSFR